MRKLLLLAAFVLALTAPVGQATATPAAQWSPAAAHLAPNTVEVTLDQSKLATSVGGRLTIESRIVNSGTATTDRLVAHLNVASLDGVYVDLEDWSADVTRTLSPLQPGESQSVSWDFQAVNAGSFDVYVVVLPNGPSSAGSGPLVASLPVHVTVAGRRTLTAGGALPVVVVIPLLLGLVAGTALYRVRRTR
jgi:hypothetical protein